MRFIILAMCLIAGPYAAAAQVAMEVRLGLQGTVRLEKWNPVTVSLDNMGASVAGTLGVRVRRGSEYRQDLHVTTFTRRVQLPHGSRKRFTFSVPITSISYPIEVFVRTADTVLAQQQLDLRQTLSAEHIIVGLTRDLSLDFLATAFQRHTRLAYLPLPDLPHEWIGYDSVTAVVVKGMSFQAITERQWTALRQWLLRGGTFVVVADSQYALLQEPRLRSVLPVAVLGMEQRDGLPVLAAHYDVPLPATPLLAVRARLQHGQVLVGTAEAPLLAQRRYGQGRVVFLAVDYAAPPLAAWQGNNALWKDILQPVDHIDFSRVFAELGLLDDAHPVIKLLGRPILAYPSHVLLSGFLLAYCSSLAVLFWWMRQRRAQRSRCWGYTLCLILGFTVGAYRVFAEPALREPALFFDVSTVDVFPEADYTHTHGYLGVFSARGGEFALDVQHAATILRHTFHRGTGKAGEALEMTTDEPLAIRGIRLAPWTLRLFSVETMTPTPLQVTAQRHSAGLTLRVHNRSALPVQGMAVVYQGRLFSFGTLAAGDVLFEEIYPTLQPTENKYETTWQALLKLRPATSMPRAGYFQEVLLQHYFGEQHLAEASATPFLVGWITAPGVLQPSLPGSQVRSMTLVVSRLSN